MIKLSILMVRRPDLTYEQYLTHWREIHGPLFAAQPDTKVYVRRYVQEHRTEDAIDGSLASRFDGVADIWFDDAASAHAFFSSDSYRRNVIPDEAALMDRARCELLFSEANTVIA